MRPSPDVSWVVEARGVTVVHPARGAFLSIPYPYAGLWAILAGGSDDMDRARRLMSLLLAIDEPRAELEIARALAVWREAGLLTEG